LEFRRVLFRSQVVEWRASPPRPRLPVGLMNHNTYRRLAALLAVPALLFTAACGADDDKNSDSADGVAQVEGKFGQKPEISDPKDTKPTEKTVVKTVSAGKGAAVKASDFVRLDWTVVKWGEDKELGGTWATAAGKKPRPQSVAQVRSEEHTSELQS